MEITEIRVFMKEGQDKKLKAYVTLTFDNCFVVRNVKVIEGTKGLFVAMPSRKVKESCPKCGFRNAVHSKFCNNCGGGLEGIQRPVSLVESPSGSAEPPLRGTLAQPPSGTLAQQNSERQSEHKDIAHPITLECREHIQKKVLEAYQAELAKGPAANTGRGFVEDF